MIHLHLFDKSTDKTVDKTLAYTSLFRQSDKNTPVENGRGKARLFAWRKQRKY
ncbi:hypothetical protein HMPREF2738_03471 [Clostridiales bacterium KLE1615]|nr:hypothetical protein HMPREF2738_03471 [Clostridiales bacterium KLE1615]